jgi:hypothetical protein
MATYLVEWYWPGVTSDGLFEAREIGIRVTQEMRGEGTYVRDLSWILIPAEELIFSLYEGQSLDAVHQLIERAGIPTSKIVEAISVADLKRPPIGTDSMRGSVGAAKEVQTEPSASGSSPKVARDVSRKRKIAALVTPAVISGFAGASPQVALDAVQQAVHDVIAQTASYKPPASGGEYFFGEEWTSSISSSNSRQAAEAMAQKVVDIALRRAGWRDCDAGTKRRYVQWILAGNMSSAQAGQVLGQGRFQANIPSMQELIRMIKKDRPSAHAPGDIARHAVNVSSAINSARRIQR